MGCRGQWKTVLAMLAIVLVCAVMTTLVKAAMEAGMNLLVFVTLHQLLGTLFLAPIAYFRERKARPKFTTEVFISHFFSAALGPSLTQYLFFLGVQYTSATFANAFHNMVPVITFFVALPFGLEALNVKSKAGIAKLLGITLCVIGAMLLTFYKGIALINALQKPSDQNHGQNVENHTHKWMVGSMALLSSCFCVSIWYLLQSRIGKKFPAPYSSTTLVFFISFLQVASLCFATQRGISLLDLKKKLVIIAIIYSGILGSGVSYMGMTWCVEKRGPIFTAAFSPLTQIIVAIIELSILHGPLYLGSVLGSIPMITGLYFLLWGKSKEGHNEIVKPNEGNKDTEGQLQMV